MSLIKISYAIPVTGIMIAVIILSRNYYLSGGRSDAAQAGNLSDLKNVTPEEKNMETTHEYKNHLKDEKSPYLIQHAGNPVDWYPWGDEAFEKAVAEDKPVFLSIGYSTCHWCHVMERESFENEDVAEILNGNFISIKVDREERPDIDSVYMKVCQSMTGGGGWPLTIVMTPEKKPFFAATYLPPEDRYFGSQGMRGLKSLLVNLNDSWRTERDKVESAAEKVTAFVSGRKEVISGKSPGKELLDRAFSMMDTSFDPEYGGLSRQGPKFPQSHNFSFLLSYWKESGNEKSLEIVETTLDNIDRGGIHDHVGGGFARYSTDREWLVPHFEKMLYDQALLGRTFIEAFQATRKKKYARTARDIFDYVIRDMTSPEGGFYSAEDADSEGVEGKFYIWTQAEIDSLLGNNSGFFNSLFGVVKKGNFEDGNNILHIPAAMKDSDLRDSPEIMNSLKKLFDERQKRVRPHLDDKLLTSWNGLMISTLAYGGAVLGEKSFIEAAKKAADFLLDNMLIDNKLYHRYRDGESAIAGFLDDYAFLSMGLIDLYEADFDIKYLEAAKNLSDIMIRDFSDNENGAFVFSSVESERLISIVKEAYDGAEPSGNSVAALALLKIGRFTGEDVYTEKAMEIFRVFSSQMENYPPGFTQMLIALDFSIRPPVDIVISGIRDEVDTGKLLRAAHEEFIPGSIIVFRPADDSSEVDRIIPLSKNKDMTDGKATVYVCANFSCKQPVNNAGQMLKLLRN